MLYDFVLTDLGPKSYFGGKWDFKQIQNIFYFIFEGKVKFKIIFELSKFVS